MQEVSGDISWLWWEEPLCGVEGASEALVLVARRAAGATASGGKSRCAGVAGASIVPGWVAGAAG